MGDEIKLEETILIPWESCRICGVPFALNKDDDLVCYECQRKMPATLRDALAATEETAAKHQYMLATRDGSIVAFTCAFLMRGMEKRYAEFIRLGFYGNDGIIYRVKTAIDSTGKYERLLIPGQYSVDVRLSDITWCADITNLFQ